jgi:F0F1-type ATP synthase delta subunit
MKTITARSATKLSAPELRTVAELAATHLGVQGTVTNVVDTTVIAGCIIEAEGRVLDLSLCGTLDRMAAQLA